MRGTVTAFTLLVSLSAFSQQESIKCSNENVSVELTLDGEAIVSFKNGVETRYRDLQGQYDGHMSSLVTGNGFAATFQNHYGCIRNFKMITAGRNGNIGHYSFKRCNGGGTPDSICNPAHARSL